MASVLRFSLEISNNVSDGLLVWRLSRLAISLFCLQSAHLPVRHCAGLPSCIAILLQPSLDSNVSYVQVGDSKSLQDERT
ncbi:unnamed protein product [Calypogeia fissa]